MFPPARPHLRLFVLLAVLFLALCPTPAAADSAPAARCPRPATTWAAQCGAAESFSVTPVFCGLTRATFLLENEGVSYRVEVAPHGAGAAFRQAGRVDLSPLGEYADWSATPRPMQDALDKMARCAERAEGDLFGDDPLPVAGRNPVPWRLFGALLACAALAIAVARRMRPLASFRAASALVAVCVGAGAYRLSHFPVAFFHQNGHGPMWINDALIARGEYGPGFAELFGWAAGTDPAEAERPVFLACALLGATVPASIAFCARGAGARWAIAFAAAFVAAIEPGLGRLAQSESYYGVCAWLLLGAAALIASGSRFGRVRSWPFAFGVVGAGLLIAQAALVHPSCWVPAALVPFAALVGRGALRRRVTLSIASALGIGAVVVAASGPMLLRIFRNQSQWGGQFGGLVVDRLPGFEVPVLCAAAILGATYALAKMTRGTRFASAPLRLGVRIATFAAVVAVGVLLDAVSRISPWLERAWWALFLPALVPAGAAIVSAVAVHRYVARALGVAIVALGLAWSARHRAAVTALPTDALEAQFAASWRANLPPGARLAYLERAGDSIATLPLYPDRDPRRLRVFALTTADPSYASVLDAEPGSFYYRGSLCSTAEGREFCAGVERNLDLQRVEERTLTALPSAPWVAYDGSSVVVSLYRIQGIRR